MIRINRKDLHLIAKEFNSYLEVWWKNKNTGNPKYDEWASTANQDGQANLKAMLEYYKTVLPQLNRISDVDGLIKINVDFYRRFKTSILTWKKATSGKQKAKTEFGMFIKKMKYSYTSFFQSDITVNGMVVNAGVWLSARLGIQVCPYCNRHYTFTIEENNNHPTVRPQFDHFLPKSAYPLTALCFFNLIPACAECNKTKGENRIKIHPYEDSFDANSMKFRMKHPYKGKNDLIIQNGDRHPNIRKLALLDLYREHIDIVEELAMKAMAYHHHYYDMLINSFSGLGISESDMERIVWGTSLETAEMESRPFSKLTRDILEQLGIKRGQCKREQPDFPTASKAILIW